MGIPERIRPRFHHGQRWWYPFRRWGPMMLNQRLCDSFMKFPLPSPPHPSGFWWVAVVDFPMILKKWWRMKLVKLPWTCAWALETNAGQNSLREYSLASRLHPVIFFVWIRTVLHLKLWEFPMSTSKYVATVRCFPVSKSGCYVLLPGSILTRSMHYVNQD